MTPPRQIRNRLAHLATLLALGLAVALSPELQAADPGAAKDQHATASPADQDRPKGAGVTDDGATLLDFFRSRTRPSPDPGTIEALIKQLDHEKFSVREQAARELVKYRRFAEPLLLEALQKPHSPEVARRARRCLERIRSGDGAVLEAAVARQIAVARPAGTAEVMLAFAPMVVQPTVLEEVQAALAAVAVKDGRPNAAVVAALADKLARKRATAAVALVRAGGVAASSVP